MQLELHRGFLVLCFVIKTPEVHKIFDLTPTFL